jgi:transposase, IS30 family
VRRSHVGTLVERISRHLMPLHLPDDASPDSVISALTAAVQPMPGKLRGSQTWDRGTEMTGHAQFSATLGPAPSFAK